MTNTQFRGSGVALVTPFLDNESIDFDSLAKLIDYCIDGGIEYLVSLGTTGESVVLNTAEKKAILEFTIKHTAGRVPIVAGFGGNNTRELIASIESTDFSGIDAILSVSPYYNKPTQAGIIAHYEAVANIAPKPIILYNVPGRTGSNITAETTTELSKHKNIIGIKEASGNFGQCMQIVKNTSADFLKISGDDNLTLPLLSLGFDGVISVSGQGFPKQFSEMVRQGLKGNFETARALHYSLVDVTDMLFAEGNPGGIKEILALAGVCSTKMRLPLVNVSQKLRSSLADAYKSIII
jgi:4-hydroxy-tetrahydrodipicolinate synthase